MTNLILFKNNKCSFLLLSNIILIELVFILLELILTEIIS